MNTQGNLDALCGVYAVINAMEMLANLDEEEKAKLFERLLKALAAPNNALKIDDKWPEELSAEILIKSIVGGTFLPMMRRLVDIGVTCCNYEFCSDDMTVRVEHPTGSNKPADIRGVWKLLHNHFENFTEYTCAAIIGLSDGCDHWTCVTRVTKSTLELKDSGPNIVKRLTKRSLTQSREADRKYKIDADSIWLLSVEPLTS